MANKKLAKKPTLLDKYDNFVNIYLLTCNLSITARKCGIAVNTANKWFQRPEVKDAIVRRQATIAQKCDVTVEECLNELQRIAFFDHKDYLKNFKVDPSSGEYGATLKDFEEMDTRALQEVSCKINAQGIPYVQIKPYNKVDALKELMNRIQGTGGDKHLHLHLNPEEMRNMSTKDATAAYQQLVEKASR